MELTVTNATLKDGSRTLEPFIVNWSRLEPLPVTPALDAGLQACIADPLWMIGRQWQFNELRGEDAGTPIDARIELTYAQIDRLRLGLAGQNAAAGAIDFAPLGRPLEAAVEAEPQPRINARLAAEAGLQCLRRLRAVGLDVAADAIRAAYRLNVVTPDPAVDSAGAAWTDLLRGRAVNAIALAAALLPFAQPDGTLSGLPTIAGIDATTVDVGAVRTVLARWLAEYRRALDGAISPRSAWVPERQEYTFAARVALADGTRVALDAREYTGGRLDWHSFSVVDDPGLGNPAAAAVAATLRPSPKLPSPVRYAGMPADRYWEFEDAAVSFGRTGGGPTELMRSLLIEFALVYGNDWFVMPFEIPIGSLCTVASLAVRDTFGVETRVPSGASRGARPWRLFELSSTGATAARSWFFLAPTLAGRLQGDPIEEVVFFRDEMANMAWAVERRVASLVDGAIDRTLEPYESILHREVGGDGITAQIVYRLQTDVPDRWIPFVPVTDPIPGAAGAFSHVLERRALIRTRPDGSRQTIQPLGLLIRTDPSQAPDTEPALRLAEEEVPREGAIATRAFEYARWLDGASHVWLGREKTIGRGEGASDLRYDILVPAAQRPR